AAIQSRLDPEFGDPYSLFCENLSLYERGPVVADFYNDFLLQLPLLVRVKTAQLPEIMIQPRIIAGRKYHGRAQRTVGKPPEGRHGIGVFRRQYRSFR